MAAAEVAAEQAQADITANNLKISDNAAYLGLSSAARAAMDRDLATATELLETTNAELVSLKQAAAAAQGEVDDGDV